MSEGITLRCVFLGAPGAGKGTQAQQLCNQLPVLHISTGDMLRQQVQEQSELGLKAKTFMDAGQLVPDELIIAMVADRIAQPDAGKAWILDGFPRTLPQAESLDRSLEEAGNTAAQSKGLTHVFYFQVPADVLVQRLTARWTCSKCGEIWNTSFKPPSQEEICDLCQGTLTQRADDRPEAVGNRLEVYRTQTEPLLGYYRSKGVLVEIDANRSPDLILQDLVKVLTAKSNITHNA